MAQLYGYHVTLVAAADKGAESVVAPVVRQVTVTGSGNGISALIGGTVPIAVSDRNLW